LLPAQTSLDLLGATSIGVAMMTDSTHVVPFGKYKGRLIEELLIDDPAYLQWLAGQDWFRTKFTVLHQTIINRGSEPEETLHFFQ
jgi:uncharacterized protein (DUF3820 family)